MLTTADLSRARIIASELEDLNTRRKLMCDQVEAAAEAQLAREPSLRDNAGTRLAGQTWPAGVRDCGQSLAFLHYAQCSSPRRLGRAGRGSARSIEGVNITAADRAHAGFSKGFGGHPMAAGLSIDRSGFRSPSWAVTHHRSDARRVCGSGSHAPDDAYMALNERHSAWSERSSVWRRSDRVTRPDLGQSRLTLTKRAGRSRPGGEHSLLTVADAQGTTQQVIWWDGAGMAGAGWQVRPCLCPAWRSANYRGQRAVQVEWIDARSSAAASAPSVLRTAIEVVDYRATTHHEIIRQLQAEGALAIWREGPADEMPGNDRYGLVPAPRLAIWTIPPGLGELRQAVAQVKPAAVFVFAADPDLDRLETFTSRLTGLVSTLSMPMTGL